MSLTASCMSYGTFQVKYDDIIEEMLIPEQEVLRKLSVLDHSYTNETIDSLKKNIVLAS